MRRIFDLDFVEVVLGFALCCIVLSLGSVFVAAAVSIVFDSVVCR